MELVIGIFVVFHLICMAFVVGNWLTNLREPRFAKGTWHAAAGSVVTGLILVGLVTANGEDVNHIKIGVKTVVALVVLGACFLGNKQQQNGAVTRGVFTVAGAAAVLNVAIAALWS